MSTKHKPHQDECQPAVLPPDLLHSPRHSPGISPQTKRGEMRARGGRPRQRTLPPVGGSSNSDTLTRPKLLFFFVGFPSAVTELEKPPNWVRLPPTNPRNLRIILYSPCIYITGLLIICRGEHMSDFFLNCVFCSIL